MTQTVVKEHGQSKGSNIKNKKSYKRKLRCPYCKEQDTASLERKGRLLVCYTCGNDSEIY